jgi:type IV pilus assembly protein PilQ
MDAIRSFVAACLLATVAVAAPARAAEPAAAHVPGTRTYDFHDIPVRSALQLIAEEGQFNLVVSDSVTGNVTLHLEDVTWEQALAVVLRLKGLSMRIDGDTRTVDAGGH